MHKSVASLLCDTEQGPHHTPQQNSPKRPIWLSVMFCCRTKCILSTRAYNQKQMIGNQVKAAGMKKFIMKAISHITIDMPTTKLKVVKPVL